MPKYNEVTFTLSDVDGVASIPSVNAQHGTVVIDNSNETQPIKYTPDADYFGDDTITVIATDNNGLITSKEVSVTVVEDNSGDDVRIGTRGDDTIEAGEGDDTIYGKEGNDFLYGEEGDDTIDGGSGDDYIDGGANNDKIDAGSGDDYIISGEGYDEIDGGSDNDTLDLSGVTDDLSLTLNGPVTAYATTDSSYIAEVKNVEKMYWW